MVETPIFNYICIDNTIIYSNRIPPNDIIQKKLKVKFNNNFKDNFKDNWIDIYITSDCNIYYNCSKDHPINMYNFTNTNYILSHLYYLLKTNFNKFKYNSHESNIVRIVMDSILEFLRINSYNAYEESCKEPIIASIYKENYLPIITEPVILSHIKLQSINIKNKFNILKKDIFDIFNDFNKDFIDLNNIFDTFSDKLKNNTKKNMINKYCQTNDKKNMVNVEIQCNQEIKKSIGIQCNQEIKKSIAIQCNQEIKKNKDNSCQTDVIINKNCINFQTENINLVEKETNIQIKTPKNKKLSKKTSNDEVISVTLEEYGNMIEQNKEKIEKELRKEYELQMKREIIKLKMIKQDDKQTNTVTKLDMKNIFSILMICDIRELLSALNVWGVHISYSCFCANLKQNNIIINDKDTKLYNFSKFWKKCVLPNIDKMMDPLFKKLKNNWIELINNILKTNPSIDDNKINVIFSYFVSVFHHNVYDNYFSIPIFFVNLFKNCRSIEIFLGMIMLHEENKEYLNELTESFVIDFQCLFISQIEIESEDNKLKKLSEQFGIQHKLLSKIYDFTM